LFVNVNFWKLIQSKIDIQETTLDHLKSNITQNGTKFNFSDLLTSDSKDSKEVSEPLAFIFIMYLSLIQVFVIKIRK